MARRANRWKESHLVSFSRKGTARSRGEDFLAAIYKANDREDGEKKKDAMKWQDAQIDGKRATLSLSRKEEVLVMFKG